MEKPDAAQLKHEADTLKSQYDDRRREGRDSPTHIFQIESYPRDAYAPETFLRKTASVDLFEEFRALCAQMWEINQEHVGERNMDIGVYFALTGIHDGLMDRLSDWCKRYLMHRLRKPHQADHGAPFRRYVRLHDELRRLLALKRERTTDYLIYDQAVACSAWLLFEETWASEIRECDGELIIEPADATLVKAQVLHLQNYGFGTDVLQQFLRMGADRGEPTKLAELSAMGSASLIKRVRQRAADIQDMRLLLLRNFRPEKSVVSVCEGLAIGCVWSAGRGVLTIALDEESHSLRGKLHTLGVARASLMRRDGQLIDPHRPWLTAGGCDLDARFSGLAVNAYVVDVIHERLFSFYDQIDFEAIRKRAHPGAGPQPSEDEDDESLAVACQDLAAQGEPEDEDQHRGSVPYRKLPPLRLATFLHVLERLGCEVKSGKGSETTVFRPGGKKYRLGDNKEVHPSLAKNVLQRLGIPVADWLAAAYH